MSALELRNVTYSYPGSAVPALQDVSLELSDGEFAVLAGLSASGKSTLLGIGSGLVPHFHGGQFAGEASVCGRDLHDHGPAELAVDVGTLFQDPETQVLMATVRAELAFPLENRGHSATAVARGVEEVALALGIGELLDRSTAQLSGGELQRVALGAALAGRPRLLVLDEPTSQLDPVAGDELIWFLRRLNEEWGTTILLAEHRLERCLAAADRVFALDGGSLACDGSPREFLEWAAVHAPPLQTPGARLLGAAGLAPAPSGVKEARATLRTAGLLNDSSAAEPTEEEEPLRRRRRRGRGDRAAAALQFERVWHELPGGRSILRSITLAVDPGELVALMGRNGAGKSTLLRHAAELLAPTRGRVERTGRVALAMQNPGDYFLAERVGDELGAAALERAGLTALADRHPGDLAGGERQRLALAIVIGDEPPAVVCLDEPTRGMDRAAKGELAATLQRLAGAGAAVVVATHDPEFAATFATRAVLLADGQVIADGSPRELLAGGWYFATETARILGGQGGALLPDEGAELLRSRTAVSAG